MTFILTELFGNSQKTRILEVFVENPDDEFLLHQVALMAEVGFHGVVWKHIMVLVDAGVVTSRIFIHCDRDCGNVMAYRLNTDNPIAKMLIMLERGMVAEKLSMVEDENDSIDIKDVSDEVLVEELDRRGYIVITLDDVNDIRDTMESWKP